MSFSGKFTVFQIASDLRFAIRIANRNRTKSRDLEHLGCKGMPFFSGPETRSRAFGKSLSGLAAHAACPTILSGPTRNFSKCRGQGSIRLS